jgi:hypothetical protein
MGLLDNWFMNLTRPLRELRSKFMGVKNIRDGLIGDIGRIKRSVGIKDPPPPAPGPPPGPGAPPPPGDPNKKS